MTNYRWLNTYNYTVTVTHITVISIASTCVASTSVSYLYICPMKFYGREQELAQLQKIRRQSEARGVMTVMSGRRRVGKTRLILESLAGEQYLYFFIARRDERLLCEEFTDQIRQHFDVPVYSPLTQFDQVFRLLINLAKTQHINLVIDEFQEFLRLNPSVYSLMQNLWDQNKEIIRMNLILCGSVQSLINRIFNSYQEPLYGRASYKFYIRPLSLSTLRTILRDRDVSYTAKDLLALFALTGGIPKYVEEFGLQGPFTYGAMLEEVLHKQSIFLDEGRFLLLQEFGKDYATYFSILALISAGKTSRGQIESVLQRPTGGYLTKLQDDYQIIKRRRPMFSKDGTTNVRYYIDDEFLRFWFRFIYRNDTAIETRNFGVIRELIDRDYTTFTGLILEKLIRLQLTESKQYSAIGRYWQRNGENEIDVIALNELTKQAVVGEVNMQEKNINLEKLKLKAEAIQRDLAGYTVTYRGFSLNDILDSPPNGT